MSSVPMELRGGEVGLEKQAKKEKKKRKLLIIDSTIRKRDGKHWIKYCGDYYMKHRPDEPKLDVSVLSFLTQIFTLQINHPLQAPFKFWRLSFDCLHSTFIEFTDLFRLWVTMKSLDISPVQHKKIRDKSLNKTGVVWSCFFISEVWASIFLHGVDDASFSLSLPLFFHHR